MWGVGGRELHRIREHRLSYKEVVKVWSNYKKSYFWWFGNLACGDSAGSNRIKKDKVMYLLDLFEGMGKKGHYNLVFGALVYNWVNAGLC